MNRSLIKNGGMRMKYLPNCITGIRILGAIILLLTEPFSITFYIIYFLCGVSDVLDGYIARKLKATTKIGQVIDSMADMIFIGAVLIMIVPTIKLSFWPISWIAVIAIIRITSLCIGFGRYNSFSSLHTLANKVTGVILFCFPIIYKLFGLVITICFICSIASISAIEELIINIISKDLNRDIKSVLIKKHIL